MKLLVTILDDEDAGTQDLGDWPYHGICDLIRRLEKQSLPLDMSANPSRVQELMFADSRLRYSYTEGFVMEIKLWWVAVEVDR